LTTENFGLDKKRSRKILSLCRGEILFFGKDNSSPEKREIVSFVEYKVRFRRKSWIASSIVRRKINSSTKGNASLQKRPKGRSYLYCLFSEFRKSSRAIVQQKAFL